MRTKRTYRLPALAMGAALLAISAISTAPASAWQREATLGASGELYLIKQGLYQDLFPGGTAAELTDPVLALDVQRPGQAVERHLVPSTADEAIERSPTVVYEDSSKSVFIVWETSLNYHPILKLESFAAGSWAPEIEIRGSLFGYKSSPQIVITRDTYVDGDTSISRTLLHLIWEEQDGNGYKTYYAPVIIENGEYIGQTPLIALNAFDENDPADLAFEVATELVQSPAIASGRDAHEVTVAFADPVSKRLVTVGIRVLPRTLNRLAERARNVIIDMGLKYAYPRNLHTMASQVQQTLAAESGGDLQPEVVQAIAQRVSERVLSPGGRNLQALAGEARNVIIDMGARLSGPGLRNATAGSSVAPKVVEIAADPAAGTSLAAGTGSPTHLLQFQIASSRPAPRVPTGDVTLFTSRNGGDVLLATVQSDRVMYRDTSGAGWSDALELGLSDSLSLSRALDILNERIRDR